jgi:hypothetical protein
MGDFFIHKTTNETTHEKHVSGLTKLKILNQKQLSFYRKFKYTLINEK